MSQIPMNCVFNKGVTGCGATTLAIEQPGHTILALPFVGLVENKAASHPNLLALHGGMGNPIVRRKKIADYIERHDTIKIAATYDLIPSICDALVELGKNPYKDMFLFVDEWHIMFNSYKLRNHAAKNLLGCAAIFERKTFVSATPVPREFWFKELTELPEYKIEWPHAKKVNIQSIQIGDPLSYMARRCKKHLLQGGLDNFHIFINSVEGIAKILRLTGLTPENCRIVCSQSKSDSSKKTNQDKLPEGFGIATVQNELKKFNFYTSTCFEGQDIFDENGRTFIVSEKYRDHTKMDVMTSLVQICGRIRDSKYKTEIVQVYSESPYKDVSLDEFKQQLMCDIEEAEVYAQKLNELPQGDRRDRLIRDFVKKDRYIGEENGMIVVDRNLANYEIVNYGIVNGQYASRCNMEYALASAGFQVSNEIPETLSDIELQQETTLNSVERTPFKKLFEEYCSLRDGLHFDISFRANLIEVEKPLIKEAYEKLGPERVRGLKYHQGNIKKELVKVAHETLSNKVFLLLDPQLPKGVAIPKSEIKKKLMEVYRGLGVNYTAKANDINEWYNVQEKRKRGDDGKMIACFAIISAKYKVAKEKN